MTRAIITGTAILAGLLMASTAGHAQLPTGMPSPSTLSLPSAGLSRDSLLQQAQALVAELTSMKASGKLAPAQATQVDTLLPRAQSVTGELQKPQVDVARLPQLASSLSDLQKQAGALKGLMK